MTGRVMMLYEPWEVTVLPETGQVRVLACYPEALAALRAAAAGHEVSEILPTDEADYTHALYFTASDPDLAAWINQYLTYLAALPDPAVPPAAEGARLAPAAPEEDAPAAMPPRVHGAGKAPTRTPPARQKASLALVLLAVLACLVMGGAYWHELTAEPAPARPAQLRPAAPVVAAVAEDDAAADPSDETDRAEPEPAPLPATPAAAPAPPPAPAGPALAIGDGKLTLWAVDVGQGDGLVLRLPGGGFAVIDANRGGAQAMSELLTAQGCRELQGLVLTHPHADHLGDLAEIAKRFRVKRFYESGVVSTSGSYRYLLRTLQAQGVPATSVQPGSQLNWDPRVQISVLSVNPDAENLNNSSVVLRLQFGSTAMLLMGDAENEVEADLLARQRQVLRANVLKVGHHGSHSSSSPEFLAAVRPQYSLISVGAGNRFHHPHPGTLQTMAAAGARVFRTDLQGTVVATSDGQRVTVGGAR